MWESHNRTVMLGRQSRGTRDCLTVTARSSACDGTGSEVLYGERSELARRGLAKDVQTPRHICVTLYDSPNGYIVKGSAATTDKGEVQ